MIGNDFTGVPDALRVLIFALENLASVRGVRLGTFSANRLDAAADPDARFLCYPCHDERERQQILDILAEVAGSEPELMTALIASGQARSVNIGGGFELLYFEHLHGVALSTH
ncbi:MAG TPA: hypothetical protein VK630_04230 [Reyranella sp.]|nr:hypothetical protein [Reyranella sp.]